ncbi:MAG: DUF111 family protein, partial [Bacteroidales bacterium]|nr:DUF111 family protein [Bacteroidales bacterium]
MDKTLYLECYSGISGDMTVAALLDLGVDPAKLQEALESLPLDGFRINISRVKKAGIDACDFDVVLEEDNHDHDMAYLHGDDPHIHEHHHDHDHDHEHCHEHDHCHEHHHDHDHEHHHHHTHRGLPEIVSIIDGSALSEGAKAIAVKIFRIIAEAEAKAHGLPVEEVHFHEVG